MTRASDLALCNDCHINDSAFVCYCAAHNSDGKCDGFEPSTAEIATDLATLTPVECAARGIRHSSQDHHYTALSDADTDAHCMQALRSAGRRQGL